MTVTITINGKPVQAEAGSMLIAASDAAGIYIPRFCYHEKLSIAANCRMCLVEVENAPKPLPACATPVTDGMVVSTDSPAARQAQQGTLEFLLINHPLDCPVCDQGGECPLQDQAMDYGNDASRYQERKRVQQSYDIGPLIATEMTRCIHCTRCVRFGEEVAGVMEMGMPGRGESAWIGTFLNRSVDSEVSGNMIDLCPVGALTAKPSKFAARAWELRNTRGISPHDCVGANLNIQTLRGSVERVLPRQNDEVNECWLADRDRYSYESVNGSQRVSAPMLKSAGSWRVVTWEKALQYASRGLTETTAKSGAQLGVLAGHICSREEYYLLAKLARGLGCSNIDHRLAQCDFRDDEVAAPFPVSEVPIAEFQNLESALLLGSNLRKEQPLLALRLRAATLRSKNGAVVHSITPLPRAQNFELRQSIADEIPAQLAGVAEALAAAQKTTLPTEIKKWAAKAAPENADARAEIARTLVRGKGAVILGALAQQHHNASVIKGLAQWICEHSKARMCVLPPGNSVAAWQAGCVPHRDATGEAVAKPGLDAAAMLAKPRKAYLLFATEPELESLDGRAARAALEEAHVICVSAYQSAAMLEYADVILPLAAFTESAGSFVNCEGRIQYADPAAAPLGESRPGWKILRVLGNFCELDGFDYVSLADARGEIAATTAWTQAAPSARFAKAWKIPLPDGTHAKPSGKSAPPLKRLLDIPMYRGDQIVRNAPALQNTADNPPPTARMNAAMIAQLGLTADTQVRVKNGAGRVTLPLVADERVPADCVYVPAGYPQTIALGGHGWVNVTEAT